MIKVGIIGGSGLDDPKILKDAKEVTTSTQWGAPSSPLTIGKLEGIDVVILARHGRKHTIMPTNVPNQANIQAFKDQGVTHIIATTACGSLREEIKPGDLVFLDQFIDRTTKRKSTFYEKDHVCHIPMATPFCNELRHTLIDVAKELKLPHHTKGTVVTIEGPRFSTKAESHMFRSWNCDVINMSTVPEVVLAREAGICYASIAMSTDYDCFMDTREPVSIGEILRVMAENVEKVKKIILHALPKISDKKICRCAEDIKTSVMS